MSKRPKEGDALPEDEAVTSREAAVAAARDEAARKSLRFDPPVDAELIFHDGRACWFVKSNAQSRGFSVEVVIDDPTGSVLETRVPRR